MREEIAAAVVFVTRLIKQNDSIPKEKVEEFSSQLSATLIDKFKNHWYADEPTKGQGYRCIRINPSEPIDPVLDKVAGICGLQYNDLNLPQELTLWVDPKEVCCRFGESQGSFCQLAVLKDDGNLENQAHTVNIEDLVKQQQQRFNMNLNIVTTRTSANKLKAMAMKSAAFQQQFYKSSYHHNSKYQQNLYNNNSQQYQSSSRPFHKSHHHTPHHHHHHKNSYHSQNMSVNNLNGHQGSKGPGDFNGGSGNFSSGYEMQGKDKYRWVRNKQQTPDQQEKMRLSPN
ncbi:maternal B9.15 protein-like [Mercenaria mercenaria]|uniref:maternal B9.15 protein-like n=1 Tax=Mercenaria mercenaria TaxID=6596 RepID=UPI001E1DE0BA|nr:maternal B9.15 protein-like [Mercenaria mercenaria]